MKKYSFILMALFFAGYADLSAQGTGETNGYRLVWQDLFNGDVLNTADNWNIEVNGEGGGNQELQYYRAENVSVGSEPVSGKNCLILTARKEPFSGKQATSGRINTKSKMRFKHGKIEASIRFPHTANGLWPAFWMLGADIDQVGWPRSGEIDIVEMGNKDGIDAGTQNRYFNGACHWGEVKNGGHPAYARPITNPQSLQDDFHLYTLVWDNNYVRMYLDLDKNPNTAPYYTMDIPSQAGQEADHPSNYLHKPFFVLFNLAVGGNFPQIWDINQVTALNAVNNYEARMYVDFVKVYQKGLPEENEEYIGPQFSRQEPVSVESQYKIYPNPANTQIRISGPKLPLFITIYDYEGKKISVFEKTDVCDISGLPKGNYLITIDDGKQEPERFHFIKK